jgi:S1-C subfamily serine protease
VSKGMGSIVSFFVPQNLRQSLHCGRGWLLVSILSLSLVACSSAAAPGDPVSPETNNNSEARAISVAENSSGAGPGVDAPLQIDALDADTIVAAQEQVLTGIYDRVVPSVVQIRSVHRVDQQRNLPRVPEIPGFPFEFDPSPNNPQGPEDFFQRSGGSGFVWDDQGRIVTNHHVIEGADRVTVIFADRTELPAEILGSDPDSDLAVLQVELNDVSQRPVELGDSASVRVGQLAAAIGNPFGQEFTITSGIISAVGRTIRSGNSQFSIPQVIQTDAPINPGNSGGPLLDRHGQVIGVNTQIISRSGASSGIGFAVPIDTAKRVVPVLIEEGKYEYAWLGISGTTLTPDAAELMELPGDMKGALVIDLSQGGPADQADLQGSDTTLNRDGIDYRLGGDIITAANGEPIRDMDELITYLIENTRPGDQIEVEVIRAGERQTLTVTLGKRPGV